jgi:hypothetical protein
VQIVKALPPGGETVADADVPLGQLSDADTACGAQGPNDAASTATTPALRRKRPFMTKPPLKNPFPC